MYSASVVQVFRLRRLVVRSSRIALQPPLSALKIAPKRFEIRAQSGFKSGLKSILGPLAELLELSWQPGGLLEGSWNALGALLEAFVAPKTLLGSALGAAKATKETGFE